MDNKECLSKTAVKQEPNSSTAKKIILSNSSFPTFTSRNNTNARLPSFKPPRDLFLTGSMTGNTNTNFSINTGGKGTKRTFMPNVHVTRKKTCSEISVISSTNNINQKIKSREKIKKSPLTKKRNSNIVQTHGVFSEGLAPGKVKGGGISASNDTAYFERQILDKPKLNLNKSVHKDEEDFKLKSILKDDFIDDPHQIPDVNFIPTYLPMVYNVNLSKNSEDLGCTFEKLQIKTERVSDFKFSDHKKKTEIISEFDCSKEPKMFLFEFPNINKHKDDSSKRKKNYKGNSSEIDKDDENFENLSSYGEGFFGYLRIHKNGKVFLVLGTSTIPLCLTRHNTRQEIVSASVDSEQLKGEIINLGTIDANFTCSANFFQELQKT